MYLVTEWNFWTNFTIQNRGNEHIKIGKNTNNLTKNGKICLKLEFHQIDFKNKDVWDLKFSPIIKNSV